MIRFQAFHAVLAWSCGLAKSQCCIATATVVGYCKLLITGCITGIIKYFLVHFKLRSSKSSGQSTAACHVGQNSSSCHIEAECHVGAAVLAHVARSGQLDAALRWTKLYTNKVRPMNVWLGANGPNLWNTFLPPTLIITQNRGCLHILHRYRCNRASHITLKFWTKHDFFSFVFRQIFDICDIEWAEELYVIFPLLRRSASRF